MLSVAERPRPNKRAVEPNKEEEEKYSRKIYAFPYYMHQDVPHVSIQNLL
jgi:hypothetical protein